MGSIKKYSDNEFYFVATYKQDSCGAVGTDVIPYTHPAIGRMDSLGNITAFHKYVLDIDCSNLPGDLIITENKSLVVWGRPNRFFVMKVDSLGTPLWARRFSDQGSFRFVKELSGGDLLVGFDIEPAGASIARLDSVGNFIWCKSYMRPTGRMHDALIEPDGSAIITGYTATLPPVMSAESQIAERLFMMKITENGDVMWCKGYNNVPDKWYAPRWSRIEKTLDGKYVVVATLAKSGFLQHHRPFLIKADQNGDTLWTRSVGATGHRYITQDLLVCSDGGFMFSGTVDGGTFPENWSGAPYIYKTDSLGHFSCSEWVHPVEVVNLFPIDSSFVLTSVDGATMHPAFVNDTIFPPLSVYNMCDIVTEVSVTEMRKPRIYPNPSPGRFNVEFVDPLIAESYYSVFDTMGRLLFQRPLNDGSTLEEVDLSRFAKGTYIIKFTSPDGVCHERVVLE
jgi:hypothetical protein